MANETSDRVFPEPQSLGVWDAASLVVGIVVGTAIFRSAPLVFQNVGGPWQGLGAWALGGALSLLGAMCYSELATAYPRSGGDYVYLSRAYGPWAGFMFGWAQLTVIFASNVGIMAYAFGDYGVLVFRLGESAAVWLAAAAIVGVTLVNTGGVALGKWTQNILSAAKVLGLAAVIGAGATAAILGQTTGEPSPETLAKSMADATSADMLMDQSTDPAATLSFGLAMVFVLYAFGGWSDAAFVAAEVRDRRRNIPLALVGGVAAITLIYFATNAAYLAALGFEGVRNSVTPAADALATILGESAGRAVSVLVMISALGAINGMILARSRVFAALGSDHRLFAWLAGWSGRTHTPARALWAQAAICLAITLGVGTETGRRAIDAVLRFIGVAPAPWEQYDGGFGTLVAASAPPFWAFCMATGVALMVLRRREPAHERPFAVPLYPLPPLAFIATCGFMLYSSVQYAKWLTLFGVAPIVLGAALYLLTGGERRRHSG